VYPAQLTSTDTLLKQQAAFTFDSTPMPFVETSAPRSAQLAASVLQRTSQSRAVAGESLQGKTDRQFDFTTFLFSVPDRQALFAPSQVCIVAGFGR
jgi:hypothetical protein